MSRTRSASRFILFLVAIGVGAVYLTIFNVDKPADCTHVHSLLDEMKQLQGEVLSSEKRIGQLQDEIRAEQMKPKIAPIGIPPPESKTTPVLPSAAAPQLKPTEYANQHADHKLLLDVNYATNNVYYMWCGRRWFEFNHYLSVKSVIRLIRPDNIIFFYDTAPIIDEWTYNTWFQELREEYPFFRLVPLSLDEGLKACQNFSRPNLSYLNNILTHNGGLYINEHTILTQFPIEDRKLSLVYGLEEASMQGVLMTRAGVPGSRPLLDLVSDSSVKSKRIRCTSVSEYNESGGNTACINTKQFFPKDIWELDDSFGKLARKIFYGNPDINLPKQDDTELIPNIAHMVWLGGGEMDFLFYLSMLSLIYVAEVDMVYLHGNAPPTGRYWQRIKSNPKLQLIYRETPKTVYGTRVNVVSHVTDVWRVDFMVKYGGIYVDTDTVFVKPLDRNIRSYDAVGSYDWTYWNHPFPDSINFGVAIGKRNAKYWQLFQESMKWFMDKDWSWNGLRQPYRIKERHPELVKIDPYLQVICFQFKCHPTWYPDYHNESRHHLNTNVIKNWREEVFAVHWTMPTPHELLNEHNLKTSKGMFADIGKFIIAKAGLFDTFMEEPDA